MSSSDGGRISKPSPITTVQRVDDAQGLQERGDEAEDEQKNAVESAEGREEKGDEEIAVVEEKEEEVEKEDEAEKAEEAEIEEGEDAVEEDNDGEKTWREQSQMMSLAKGHHDSQEGYSKTTINALTMPRLCKI